MRTDRARKLIARSQINDQLAPARRVGLGDAPSGGIPNFAALTDPTQNPQAYAVWYGSSGQGGIAAQLASEGAGPAAIQAAQQNFLNSYTQMVGGQLVAGNVNSQITQIAQAAGAFVLNNNTIGGASQAVSDLIGSVTSGQPPTVETVTGLMGSLTSGFIGTAVASGAITLGIGAAITFAVGILVTVLDGLFGSNSAPPGVSFCGGTVNVAPSYSIGCGADIPGVNGGVYVISTQPPPSGSQKLPAGSVPAGPTSTYWRHFPKPGATNAASGPDAWWYTYTPTSCQALLAQGDTGYSIEGCTQSTASTWTNPTPGAFPGSQNGYPGMLNDQGADTAWPTGPSGSQWQDMWGGVCAGQYPNGCAGVRPIDMAWPQFHHLECEAAIAQAVVAAGTSGTFLWAGSPGFPVTVGPFTSDQVALASFQLAYFAAWKINKEYQLNGLACAQDYQVLLQVLQHWNACHSSSSTITLAPVGNIASVISPTAPCPLPETTLTPYASLLLSAIDANAGSQIATGSANATTQSNGSIAINAGAQIGALLSSVAGARTIKGVTAGTALAAKTSSSNKLLVGTAIAGGAGLAALVLYARHKRSSLKQASKNVWSGTKRAGSRVASGTKKLVKKA